MLPRNESGMRKFDAENLDWRRAELPWDEPVVLRDFKCIMNLFISTRGCTIKSGLVCATKLTLEAGVDCRRGSSLWRYPDELSASSLVCYAGL